MRNKTNITGENDIIRRNVTEIDRFKEHAIVGIV